MTCNEKCGSDSAVSPYHVCTNTDGGTGENEGIEGGTSINDEDEFGYQIPNQLDVPHVPTIEEYI